MNTSPCQKKTPVQPKLDSFHQPKSPKKERKLNSERIGRQPAISMKASRKPQFEQIDVIKSKQDACTSHKNTALRNEFQPINYPRNEDEHPALTRGSTVHSEPSVNYSDNQYESPSHRNDKPLKARKRSMTLRSANSPSTSRSSNKQMVRPKDHRNVEPSTFESPVTLSNEFQPISYPQNHDEYQSLSFRRRNNTFK